MIGNRSMPGSIVIPVLGYLDVGGSVRVRVEDLDAHCRRARRYGARILDEPADYPYGERQYSVEDRARM